MKEFWDQRYADENYAYGIKPNAFFAEEIEKVTDNTLLLPAEGEGRNAVYAALAGWKVSAFDYSFEAQMKAIKLAHDQNVKIEYQVNDFQNISYPHDHFDCIVLIFVHMPAAIRRTIHRKLLRFLKPGGKLILEAFSKAQLEYSSGGPKNEDLLFSTEELYGDFEALKNLKIGTTETVLDEGFFHQGKASVIRVTGYK